MKDILLPLVLITAAIGGTWYYVSVTTKRDANARALSSAPADPPAVTAPQKKHAPIHKAVKPEPVEEAETVAAPPRSEEIVRPVRVPKPVPTGTLSEIKPGMMATQVVDLLGEPKLTAVTIERGTLLETYVYDREPGDGVWLIHLRGGRVDKR